MKLYEYPEQLEILNTMPLDSDEDKALFDETLENIQIGFKEKIEGCAVLIKNWEADCKILKEEEKRLAERRAGMESSIVRLKDYMQINMDRMNMDKLVSPLFTIGVQNSPPSVLIKDEADIPKKFYVPQPDKIDRKAISEALKNGEELSFAELVTKRHIRIR
jgi:hypothetical protein